MLIPPSQGRLIEILCAEQADLREAAEAGVSMPARIRRADRAFELALLISEQTLAVTLLHAADRWVRPRRLAPHKAC